MNALAENTEIQALIERYRQAVVAKDLETLMGFYADSIVSFDAVKALQFKGKAAYRAHWEECMNYCPGPHLFEFAQLQVVQGQDLAFAHWLVHCGGRMTKVKSKAAGCEPPQAISGSPVNGESSTSTGQRPSTWSVARRCSTCSPDRRVFHPTCNLQP